MINKIIGAAAIPAVKVIGNVIDSIFTSDEEKLDKKIILERLALQPQLAQIELNKVEAAHRSIFVAGWRPFIGWVCGLALFYNYVIRDIIGWLMNVVGVYSDLTITQMNAISTPPELAIETLTSVLLALLGLGGLRTIEKLQGRAK